MWIPGVFRRSRRLTAAGISALLVPLVVAGAPAHIAADQTVTDEGTAAVIARYQARIPQLMTEQNVPGLAVALVDRDAVLWAQGFGHLDGAGSAPVTPDTIFSVQSMSKLFTATAVMEAVQAGRLELDAPITTYLPDFTVHSVFEEHPERRITLRMLLSHTAGFTHEAPVGNNSEIDPGTFDTHVRSISDTWLRFPVGTGYAYSNLGIDLAGSILERVYNEPFPSVMRDLVLGPLGMTQSTFDRADIRSTTNRAVGHTSGLAAPLLDIPMTAAGGLYTSASDLARFISFELFDGTIAGRAVLEPTLMDEMRTVPAPNAGAPAGYALGVERTRWRSERYQDLFFHGGGGWGFLSDLWWVPKLQLGIAILTNSADHHLQGDVAISIMRDLVDEPTSVFHQRLLSLPSQSDVVDFNDAYQPPPGMSSLIAAVAMPPSDDRATSWATYEGTYRVAEWGVLDPIDPPDRFVVAGGIPYFDTDESEPLVRHRLTEVEPGRFLADNGETLDFRGTPPTWRNLDLVRVSGGPAASQWALLCAGGLVALGWLVMAGFGWLRRRRSSPSLAIGGVPPRRGLVRVTSALAVLTATFALGAIALLVAVPGLVDSGFLGWLELPTPLKLALHVPLALAILAGSLVILTATGWRRRWWSRGTGLRFAALAASAIVLVGQLAAWHLIGWGLS